MIVNHFKMRTNIMTYNLSGMGCSAGVISIGLAQQLLQVGAAGQAGQASAGQHTAACCGSPRGCRYC